MRKCYFPDYRFSEDLDFTSINTEFKLTERLMHEIMTSVQERTEMPLHLDKLKELRHKDMLTGYAAIVKFWGADHAKEREVLKKTGLVYKQKTLQIFEFVGF